MATTTRPPVRVEVYMELHDRHYMKYLMASRGVSTRGLAEAVGWSSHSFVIRLLQGKVKTLDPDKALAIAEKLGLASDVGRLFTPRVSRKTEHPAMQKRSA